MYQHLTVDAADNWEHLQFVDKCNGVVHNNNKDLFYFNKQKEIIQPFCVIINKETK